MGIIKRILLLLFGFLSGMVGFISVVVSVALMTVSFSEIDDLKGRVFLTIWIFIICEVLLAFGIATSLLGLRCVFGPRDWIIKVIDYFWGKTIQLALILPFLAFGFAAIIKIIDFFIS